MNKVDKGGKATTQKIPIQYTTQKTMSNLGPQY